MSRPALGLIEVTSLSGALQATRAATRAANVAIASAERIDADHVVVKVEGDWNVVQKAVEAGALVADKLGQLISMHVIPRTDQDLSAILPYNRFLARYLENAPGSHKPKRTRPRVTKPRPAPEQVTPAPEPQPTPEPEPAPRPAPPVEKPMPAPPKPTPGPAVVIPQPVVAPTPTSPPAPANADGAPSLAELEALSVVKLRRYARGLTGLGIQGRQISMANKHQLLAAIKEARGVS